MGRRRSHVPSYFLTRAANVRLEARSTGREFVEKPTPTAAASPTPPVYSQGSTPPAEDEEAPGASDFQIIQGVDLRRYKQRTSRGRPKRRGGRRRLMITRQLSPFLPCGNLSLGNLNVEYVVQAAWFDMSNYGYFA